MDDETQPDQRDMRSPEDCSAAVGALTDEDFSKLLKVAAILQWSSGVEAKELLNEAIARTLAGRRHWPSNVDAVRFVAKAMKSIAHAEKKHGAIVRGLGPASDSEGNVAADANVVGLDGQIVMFTDTAATPEDLLVAAEETEGITAWRREFLAEFDDDYDAQIMVEGMLEGYEGEELKALTGLDDTAFVTKQRKVQRRRLKFEAKKETVMTDNRNDDREALKRLDNAVIDNILAMTDEEVRAEAAAEGIDLKAQAAEMRAMLAKTSATVGQTRLVAAREAFEARRLAAATPMVGGRAPAAANDFASARLTRAARSGTEESEADAAGTEEDLAELAAFLREKGDQ